MKKITLSLLALTTALGAAAAQASSDGKDLYGHFRCGECHGSDGKMVGAQPGMKAIAGMSSAALYEKTMKIVQRGDHQATGSGCGETPSREQVRVIADYVSALGN